MRIEPEVSGVGVVLIGNFNPAIFTPAWFALHGLLPKEAMYNAELQIAHPELTVFITEWLQLKIRTDRFEASTERNPYVRIRDLLIRVFNEQLHHTPLSAVGINREVHFPVANVNELDRIRKRLAPAEPWGPWKARLGLNDTSGGMTSLTITKLRPEGRLPGGVTNVTVEPSRKIAGGRYGVYVRVNDHYETGSNDVGAREQLMSALDGGFEESIDSSDDIICHVMSL